MSTLYRDIMKANHRLGDINTLLRVQRHRVADLGMPSEAGTRLEVAVEMLARAQRLIREAAELMPDESAVAAPLKLAAE